MKLLMFSLDSERFRKMRLSTKHAKTCVLRSDERVVRIIVGSGYWWAAML